MQQFSRQWREGKVRPLPGNSPHDRLVSRGSSAAKESLRRSLRRHWLPAHQNTEAPQYAFLGGMAESIWSDGVSDIETKTLSRNRTASRQFGSAQVKKRDGRITLLLIVRR